MTVGPAGAALEGDLARVEAVFERHDAGRYLNFTEEPHTIGDVLGADAATRLRSIRARVDPDEVLLANFPI
jgi:hypothetical protein